MTFDTIQTMLLILNPMQAAAAAAGGCVVRQVAPKAGRSTSSKRAAGDARRLAESCDVAATP